MHREEFDREEFDDSRPFLTIPYWSPGDTGDVRPLPSTVTWYLAGGIRTSTYRPGELLEVEVDVRNSGGSNAPSLAQVTVWWSDPALGFVIKPENLLGFRQVPVPPRGETRPTSPIARRMPADAPNHICLLARVSHPLDPAPPTAMPVQDRHWAQRNLSVVPAPPGAPVVVTFSAANPLPEALPFRIRVGPASQPALMRGEDGVVGDALTEVFALIDVDGEIGEGTLETGLDLEPGEVREVTATISVPELEPGRFAVFEISQLHREQLLGGIGVVIVGSRN